MGSLNFRLCMQLIATCLLLQHFILVTQLSLQVQADAEPLLDFCVADPTQPTSVGYNCKPVAEVTVKDFVFSLDKPIVQALSPDYPGLNSLGSAISRFDIPAGEIVNPHTHPRATEIFYVKEGTFYAGFVSVAGKLYDTVIKTEDVIIFPQGLIHFAYNLGNTTATIIVWFNSENPGTYFVAPTLFGSGINATVLEKAFDIDAETLKNIEKVWTPHIPPLLHIVL
jgi:quercetin dioxygenase-like cupin family protein